MSPSPETAIEWNVSAGAASIPLHPRRPTGAVQEFLDWVLGEEGQKLVSDIGYVPVHGEPCGDTRPE